MRILTIIDHLGPGGRQRTAQNYALGYRRLGHEAAVLALTGAGPRLAELRRHGVPVFLGGASRAAQTAATDDAGSWRPDVVHLHSVGPVGEAEARAVGVLKARARSLPVVETTSFGKVDYRQRYALSDVLLLKSRWALWRWTQWSRPLPAPPVGAVVPNTIHDDAFHPSTPEQRAAFRSAHAIPEDAFVFGRIGQPSVWKWDPVIFGAFAAVAQRHAAAHLLLVGLPPELRPHLNALAPAVRRRVVEIPFLRGDVALQACYGALDVFLHAARIGESFGLVLAEAMLSGCPVITLSTPARDNSQLEVVGHLRGGLVVNDEVTMISAMNQLLHDRPLRRRLACEGADYVRAAYTPDVVIPQLVRILETARTAPSREALRHALRADPTVTTEVSDAEIGALLANTLGRAAPRQLLLMRLVHTPLLARAWWAAKTRLRQLLG